MDVLSSYTRRHFLERKLASIQTIEDLHPIEGADNIEVARILGWNVVVKKGQFNVGDIVVYCEIDSVMPADNPEFEFLRDRKYRIKTVKLRGQISQGIIFPIDILPEDGYAVDDDVTKILDIIKYEPPVFNCGGGKLGGHTKSTFPSFIPKTDEIRVQTISKLLPNIAGVPSYITEKIEGTSITSYIRDDIFGVCSRNMEKKLELDCAYAEAAIAHGLEEKLKSINKNIAIQGELIGPGIQKNIYRLNVYKIYFYNAWYIDEYKYFSFEELKQLLKDLELDMVPILDENHCIINSVDFYVELSKGNSLLRKESKREGIVIRCPNNTEVYKLGRLSFKSINPEFLLKQE
jgi:RNA ligase (TIGR02306 family)